MIDQDAVTESARQRRAQAVVNLLASLIRRLLASLAGVSRATQKSTNHRPNPRGKL
jgi:hypothetical protein